RSPAQCGTSFSVTPGIPFTTRTTVPAMVSVAPTAPRRDRRSPRYHGLKRIIAIGSTVIRRAAFVAVEWAIPQLEQIYAPANPRIPIHMIARGSAPDNGSAGCRRDSSRSTSQAMKSRENASVAGGTLCNVTRATTYDVPYTTLAASITTSAAPEEDRVAVFKRSGARTTTASAAG